MFKYTTGLNLITVQQDATYSVYYISEGSSTCFACLHPSSGAHTTVITASGSATIRSRVELELIHVYRTIHMNQ